MEKIRSRVRVWIITGSNEPRDSIPTCIRSSETDFQVPRPGRGGEGGDRSRVLQKREREREKEERERKRFGLSELGLTRKANWT